ncbi:hypothetical protein IEQ34_014436 [Dendrobium chrysotoxum]|uniref:Uncharacterized protein n=1 Tax=Dendrobium chrysotoxum TaxID=161865 RepID=A0AAV7GM13_DENCH|nr:hypothetical protein IEQ34_014436 [Dendrobium chrysotoxum]
MGKKMAFLVIRQFTATVQCVLMVTEELVSTQMVKYATFLSRESIVDIKGEATKRLEALYPTLKELALAGSPDREEIEREGSSCVRYPESTEHKRAQDLLQCVFGKSREFPFMWGQGQARVQDLHSLLRSDQRDQKFCVYLYWPIE